MAKPPSRCFRPPFAASLSTLPPYHPSWNPDGCRAVRHVLRHHGTGAGARALAKFDGSDEHRVHADECPVADLGPALVRAVEIGGYRTRAYIRVLADVGVAQVGHVRNPAPPAHLGPHELGEAADVYLLADLGARPKFGERAAVGAVANPRVLYIPVGSDSALGHDFRFAIVDRRRLNLGV